MSSSPIPQDPIVCYSIHIPEWGTLGVALKNPNGKGRTKGWDNKRPNRNNSIAASVDQTGWENTLRSNQVSRGLSLPDAPTEDQDRSCIMSLLKNTMAETNPANPILKNGTINIILGNIKTSPKWHAPSVPFSVLPGTPSRRREEASNTKNKTWDLGSSIIS